MTDDHGNPHVHVLGPGAKAKIFLETLDVESSVGFSEKALNQIVKKVKEFREILLESWEEYHGEKSEDE